MMKLNFVALLMLMSLNTWANLPTNPASGVISSIKILAAEDRSCERSSECRAIAVGKRACGGPREFVITSVNNRKSQLINSLAEISAVLEHAYNVENGVISICVIAPRPVASCVENFCVDEMFR